jgi:hypothetical protein
MKARIHRLPTVNSSTLAGLGKRRIGIFCAAIHAPTLYPPHFFVNCYFDGSESAMGCCAREGESGFIPALDRLGVSRPSPFVFVEGDFTPRPQPLTRQVRNLGELPVALTNQLVVVKAQAARHWSAQSIPRLGFRHPAPTRLRPVGIARMPGPPVEFNAWLLIAARAKRRDFIGVLELHA